MKFGLDKLNSLYRLIKELSVGLTKLSFFDNFESFEVHVTIPPITESKIRNRLEAIPTRRLIVKQNIDGVISDGTTEWSKDFVYLYNNHASNTVNLTVIFLK